MVESKDKFLKAARDHGGDQALNNVKKMEEVMDRVSYKIYSIFKEEMMKDKECAEALIHSLIYAPLSYSLSFLAEVHTMGFDPKESFPTFITVYMNLFKLLDGMENDYKKLPFKEFEGKLRKKFEDMGHYAFEVEVEDGN